MTSTFPNGPLGAAPVTRAVVGTFVTLLASILVATVVSVVGPGAAHAAVPGPDGESYTIIPVPEPTVEDPCGAGNATWNVPEDTEKLRWFLQADGELIVEIKGPYIDAYALDVNDDYDPVDNPGGLEWGWNFETAPDTPCTTQIPVPEQPEVNDPCGPENAEWIVPEDTEQVRWFVDDGQLIAEAEEGFEFANGEPRTNFGYAPDSGEPCDQVVEVPEVPGSLDPCGAGNLHWDVPADTDELDWTLTDEGRLLVETKPGYTFRAEGRGRFTRHVYGPVIEYYEEQNTAPCPSGFSVEPDEGSCQLVPKAVVTLEAGASIGYQVKGDSTVHTQYRGAMAGTHTVTLPRVAPGEQVTYRITVMPLDHTAHRQYSDWFTFTGGTDCGRDYIPDPVVPDTSEPDVTDTHDPVVPVLVTSGVTGTPGGASPDAGGPGPWLLALGITAAAVGGGAFTVRRARERR